MKALVEKIPEEQRSRQEEALERLWDTYKKYQDNPLAIKTDALYKAVAFPSMFMAKTLQAIDLPEDAMRAANLATECFNLAKWEQKMVESLMTYLYCRLSSIPRESFKLDQVLESITDQVKTICRHRGYDMDPRPACSFDLPLRRAHEAVWNTFSSHMEALSEQDQPAYLERLKQELTSAWNFPSHDRLKERVRLFREQVSEQLPEQVQAGIEAGDLRPFHEEIIPVDLHDPIREAAKAADRAKVVELITPTVESQMRTLSERLDDVMVCKPPYRPRSLPRDVYGRWVAAERLDSEGELARAEQAFGQLFSEAPEYPILKEWLAFCQARLGNLAGAQRMLEQVVNVKRSNYLTFWNLSCIHFQSGELESSQRYLDQDFLLQNNMRNQDFIEAVLGLTIRLGWDERLLELIDHFPTNEYSALGLYMAAKVNNEQQSSNYLDRLLQLLSGPVSFDPTRVPGLTDPRPGGERLKRAFSYFIASGLEEQGIAYFTQRTRNFPNSYIDLEYLARLYENIGKVQEALEAVTRKVRITNRSRAHISTKREVTGQLLQFVARHKLENMDPLILDEARELEVEPYLIEQVEPLVAAGRVAAAAQAKLQTPLPAPLEYDDEPLAAPARIVERAAARPPVEVDLGNVAAQADKLSRLDDLIPAYALAESALPALAGLGSGEGRVGQAVHDALELARGLYEDQHLELSHGDLEQLNGLRRAAIEAQSALVGERGKPTQPLVRMLERLLEDLGKQVRLLPDLGIEAVSPFLCSDLAETSLVLAVHNREPLTQQDVSVSLFPVGDSTELLGPAQQNLGDLIAGQRRLIKFRLRVNQTEGKLAFKVKAELSVGDKRTTIEPGAPLRVIMQPFHKGAGVSALTSPFFPLRDIPANRPDVFVGRERELQTLVQSLSQVPQGRVPFLDGIKRVGKTSLLNFMAARLPEQFCAVRLNLEGLLSDPRTSKAAFYRSLCSRVSEALQARGRKVPVPSAATVERDPNAALADFFSELNDGEQRCVLLFDEFQYAVRAIVAGAENGLDSGFLALLSAELEEGRFSSAFTSAQGLDDLGRQLQHNLFSRFVRVRVAFLDKPAHDALLAGALKTLNVVYDQQALDLAFEYTGGHPAFAQLIGDWLVVNALGGEGRVVLTPDDVHEASEALVKEDAYFATWWDPAAFGEVDALLVRRMLELGSAGEDELLSALSADEQIEGRQSIERLQAAEILAGKQQRFTWRSRLLREHLARLIKTRGALPHQAGVDASAPVGRHVALFMDHENLFLSLQTKFEERGIDLRDPNRMQHVIDRLRERAAELGPMARAVAVANWDNPVFSAHQRLYRAAGFDTLMPPDSSKDGADFELYDEIARVASEEGRVGTFILVSADRDFSRIILRLRNQEGRSVRVWAVRGASLSDSYRRRLGRTLEFVDDLIKL